MMIIALQPIHQAPAVDGPQGAARSHQAVVYRKPCCCEKLTVIGLLLLSVVLLSVAAAAGT
jgi:hypothetical protein